MAAETNNDRLDLLTSAIREKGQAQVARELGYSPAAICQVAGGTYKGDIGRILRKAAEAYGEEMVDCSILGKISLGRCAGERNRTFSAASPMRLRLWKACRACGRNA